MTTLPPGPKGRALIKHALAFRHDPLLVLDDLMRQYGDIVYLRLGTYNLYLLRQPEHLYEMLVGQARKLIKPRVLARPLYDFIGTGLLISEGEFWKRQRHLAQPAFHHRRVAAYAEIMVDCVKRAVAPWQSGQMYDIDREIMRLTLPIVLRTLFSSDMVDSSSRVAQAVDVIQKITYHQGYVPVRIPRWFPFGGNPQKQKAIGVLDDIIYAIIREKRRHETDTGDLLSMLVLAEAEDGSRMTDKQVRDEIMTILVAGHDSTANALTWTFYLLAQYPEVEARLHQELDSVLGDRLPAMDDLPRLPYNEMVIKEALRLYPPAWSFPRQALERVTIGGYSIPENSVLLGVVYLTHRDPRNYPQPDDFIPERFTAEAEKVIPRFAYLPFGSGPRFCIGNAFAMMTAQLTLAAVAGQYRLSLVPEHPVIPEALFTLRPRSGMMMRVTAR